MVHPDKVGIEAKKKEHENFKFRSFLKRHADADYLGITVEQFIDFFLEKEEFGIGYHTKHKPCDFLQEDGNCKLGDCKPDSCKKYPYTDQPERLCSLLGMLDTISICPVAFEIFERLKKSTDLGRRRGTYEKRGIFRTMENII